MARNKTVNIGNVNASLDERTGYIRLTSKAKGALKDKGFVVNVKPDSEEHFMLLGEIEGKHGEIENLEEMMYHAPRSASKPYELLGVDESYELHPSRIPVGEDTRNGKVSYWVTAKDDSRDPGILSPHMLITGGTGQGKTTIIANIVDHLNFFPEKIQMFYSNHKAEVEPISHYVPDLGKGNLFSYETDDVSIFSDALKIMKERYEFMEGLGISTMDEMIRAKKAKRTYLLIDGAQELLFFSEHKDLAHELLSDLLRYGRAAGVHVLLAAQMADFVSDDILYNIGSRIHCFSSHERGLKKYRATFQTFSETHLIVPFRVPTSHQPTDPLNHWNELIYKAEKTAEPGAWK